MPSPSTDPADLLAALAEALAAIGAREAVNQQHPPATRASLILNWFEGLKAKVPSR